MCMALNLLNKKVRFVVKEVGAKKIRMLPKSAPKIHHKDAEKGCDVVACNKNSILFGFSLFSCMQKKSNSVFLLQLCLPSSTLHSFRIPNLQTDTCRVSMATGGFEFFKATALNWLSPDSVTRMPGFATVST